MKKKIAILALALIAAAGGGFYLWQYTTSGDVASSGTGSGDGATATVTPTEGVIAVAIDAPALIRPYREVVLRSASGGTVTSVADLGQSVRAGQVVAQLDTTDLERAVERSRIDLEESQINLERAGRTLERAQRDLEDTRQLQSAGGASREQLQNAEDALVAAENSLRLGELSVARAELNLRNAVTAREGAALRSPWDGVVLAVAVGPGDSVGTNSALVTVAQLDRVRVSAEIDEYDVARLAPGLDTTVRVEAVAGTGAGPFTGVVESISPSAQVVSNISVFTVSTVVANPGLVLRPGMSADLTVAIARDEGLVIPARAITVVRTRSYVDVLRINDEGIEEPETVRITAGATDGVNTVVLEGLDLTDRLVMPETAAFALPSSPAAPAASSTSIVPMSVPGAGGGSGGGGGAR